MPRTPRKPPGRKKGYRTFIGSKRKGQRQYRSCLSKVNCSPGSWHLEQASNSDEKHEAEVLEVAQASQMAEQNTSGTLDVESKCDVLDREKMDPEQSSAGFHGFAPFRWHLYRSVVSEDSGSSRRREYFASEIDLDAIAVQRKRFPVAVTRVGCVKSLDEKRLDELGLINLLIGGSPCNDLSRVNPARRGLYGEGSTGQLFFEYIRVLKHLKKSAKERGETLYYLYENTFNMDLDTMEKMIECFGHDPKIVCASSFVPMVRRRIYFHNLPDPDEDHVPRVVLPLQAYLDHEKTANVNILPTVTTNSSNQRKKDKFPVIDEYGEGCLLTVNELEVLFGFESGYTDNGKLSISKRRHLIGLSWVVPVVAHLLQPLQNL
ncbi:DNA (cytosine-5)-methyltransferase 3A [Frankliniella fusca]|uniref:DNA (cytosine-5-)-methyltransferase n=1 Tax=Frankliniella fusca TaxID=407009 RepID=A0AAE1LS73_9NEOP|nr:DNA (cytosine-5)-methyltransferase 3A [Frankliniella fusca]